MECKPGEALELGAGATLGPGTGEATPGTGVAGVGDVAVGAVAVTGVAGAAVVAGAVGRLPEVIGPVGVVSNVTAPKGAPGVGVAIGAGAEIGTDAAGAGAGAGAAGVAGAVALLGVEKMGTAPEVRAALEVSVAEGAATGAPSVKPRIMRLFSEASLRRWYSDSVRRGKLM